MCVDYKASPKNDFPLPIIDALVDNIVRHALFSFMNGFSGCNQIRTAPEDFGKTLFINPWGTFYYKLMCFELNNGGATYLRAMMASFRNMMHKEMDVYVDNRIAKSKTKETHLEDLRKIFE